MYNEPGNNLFMWEWCYYEHKFAQFSQFPLSSQTRTERKLPNMQKPKNYTHGWLFTRKTTEHSINHHWDSDTVKRYIACDYIVQDKYKTSALQVQVQI